MRDYYYILGVNKGANLQEIQKAYKKLALKFHPDKNGNDPFYALHYAKITEAYKVLSDDHKRFRYDKAKNKEITTTNNPTNDGPPPVISFFFASKSAGKKGDLMTISWEVLNADEVHINLIGYVSTNGTQTIRLLQEEETEEFLTIKLIASNNNSEVESKKVLKIVNLSYSPKEAALKTRLESLSKSIDQSNNEPFKKDKESSLAYGNKNSGIAYLLVAVMCFIIFVMLYKIHTINPFF